MSEAGRVGMDEAERQASAARVRQVANAIEEDIVLR